MKVIIEKELEQRTLKDPAHWGSQTPERISAQDAIDLVGQLMTTEPYTVAMREIVNWYKRSFAQQQLILLIHRVLNHQQSMIKTLRVRS